jgi:hypothetical protein
VVLALLPLVVTGVVYLVADNVVKEANFTLKSDARKRTNVWLYIKDTTENALCSKSLFGTFCPFLARICAELQLPQKNLQQKFSK